MAELVQGQSAPVGMKAEGFVDALHRVRQVRAQPAGRNTRSRGGAWRAGKGSSGLGAGGSLNRRLSQAGPFRGVPTAGRSQGDKAPLRGPGPTCRAGLPGA